MVGLTVNGTTYNYPTTGDDEWGDAAWQWAQAMTLGCLQKAGGLFTLTAEVDFDANFGLKSVYYKSRATNPAGSGQVRLGNTEAVAWRNAANNADLLLAVNASNQLTFNGTVLASSAGVVPATAGGTGQTGYTVGDTLYADTTTTLAKLGIGAVNTALLSTGSAPSWGLIANANVSGSAAIAYSKLALTGAILNADLAGSIALSKLANVAANSILGNNTGSPAAPVALTVAQVNTLLGSLSNPMTTLGDVIYSSDGSGTPARLAGNTTATKKYLTQTGNGSASAAPAWAQPIFSDLGYATTATAAGTTTLTVASSYIQFFTGSTTQTVVLPDCTTLTLGHQFTIVNNSTGAVTVNKNGGTLSQYLGPNSRARFTCTSIGSAAGTWDVEYSCSTRQVVVGTAQTAVGTTASATFANITNQPTVTFTANFTGKYKISLSGDAYNGSAATNTVRLNASAGSPTVTFSQEAAFDSTVSGLRTPISLYVIAGLTAGTSYTFGVQAKTTAGTFTLDNAQPSNGTVLVAEQLE